jgi:uncharacterized protein YjiS (DUF1127 family)
MLLVRARPRGFGVQHVALRAMSALRAVTRRFQRYRRTRRELDELATMDDRMLRDIGLSRCEVRGAIRSGTELRSLPR